ncbi:hypothetical protein AMJ85_01860 [candidate division BRC1 bacterium SM23_51]|nr:MAG: hypothetical protein AMJ85_01860 [candidate division BRC1 bacterium SM23_51]
MQTRVGRLTGTLAPRCRGKETIDKAVRLTTPGSGEAVLLRLSGIVGSRAAARAEAVVAMLSRRGHRDFIFDFCRAARIDRRAASKLSRLGEQILEAQGLFALAGPEPLLRPLLGKMRSAQEAAVFASGENALDAWEISRSVTMEVE